MKKFLAFILSLFFASTQILFAGGSFSLPHIERGGSGGGGGGTAAASGLQIETVYPEGHRTMATNFAIAAPTTTYNGYQYTGFWDNSRYLALGKRLKDSPIWSYTFFNGLAETPTFSGAGLNDMHAGGLSTATSTSTYDVEIDGTGAPDTFKWRKDGGAYTTGVSCSTTAVTLASGVTIFFDATTGHTVGNSWTFKAQPQIQLAGDGDLHQGISIAFDPDGFMHINYGSYVTASPAGLHYRMTQASESISGVTAPLAIQAGATTDDDASYVQWFNDPTPVGNDHVGPLYVHYRCNGASGNADHCMYKYNEGTTTWSYAPGTQSSVVIGRFINGVASSKSAYVGTPLITSDRHAHFVWSWDGDSVANVITTGVGYVDYNIATGAFTQADSSSQTIPINYSNADNVDEDNSAGNGLDSGLHNAPYVTSVIKEDDGTIDVVYERFEAPMSDLNYTGSGSLDDMTQYGVAYGLGGTPTIDVKITTAASPQDSFQYRVNGGAWQTSQKITGYRQHLANGIYVKWAAVTGHTTNDAWRIYPKITRGNLFRRYWTGSAWSTKQQLTNMVEGTDINLFSMVSDVLYRNGKAYIVYGGYEGAAGTHVIETSDWTTFRRYSILSGGGGRWGGAVFAPYNYDRAAWYDYGVFYSSFQFNPDYYGSVTVNSPAPIYMLRWDPSTGAGMPKAIFWNSNIAMSEDYHHGSYFGADTTWGTSRFIHQHFWWLMDSDTDASKPQDEPVDFIANRVTAGDLVYLPANTAYALKSPLIIGKSIELVCPAGPESTIISNANAGQDAIQITASNVRIIGCGVSLSGTGTQRGVYALSGVSTPLTGIVLRDVKVSGTKASGVGFGFHFANASGDIYNPESSLVVSGTNNVEGIYVQNDSSLTSTTTTVNIYNPKIITAGAGTSTNGIGNQDNSASKNSTVNVYGGYIALTESAAATTCGILSTGGTDAITNVYGTRVSGTDNDFCQASSGVLNLYGATSLNGTRSGTITTSGHAMDSVYTKSSAANQACNTTCTTGSCKGGQDSATKDLVDCADATADVCFCT